MNLFSLQWKETFRAPQWEAKLSIKIIMALVMIYFLVGKFHVVLDALGFASIINTLSSFTAN